MGKYAFNSLEPAHCGVVILYHSDACNDWNISTEYYVWRTWNKNEAMPHYLSHNFNQQFLRIFFLMYPQSTYFVM